MHEVFFPFGSDVSFILFALDDLLVTSCQLMQHCLVINWGHKWKTRVSTAGHQPPLHFSPCAPSRFLPLLKKKLAPPTQANIEVDNTHKDLA